MVDLGDIAINGVKSVLSGGALGVVGAIGSGIIDLFQGKEKTKELASKVEIVKAAPDKAIDILKALNYSYDNDKATYKKAGFVDTVRGLVRPFIIGVLLVSSMAITIDSFLKVGLAQDVMKDIAIYGFYMCLNLTSTCVTWYFGGRELLKMRRK